MYLNKISTNYKTNTMLINKTTIFLVLGLVLAFTSCKKDKFTIQGQIKEYGFLLPDNMLAPVVGLPVSIYSCKDPYIENPLSDQKFRFKSITDANGYYYFTVEEPENFSLEKYNAYLVKDSPFDSTKVEWQYANDTTFYRVTNSTGGIGFSHVIRHSIEPKNNGFKVVPSGWIVVKVVNPTCSKFTLYSGNNWMMMYNSPYGSLLTAQLWVSPSKTHNLKLVNTENQNHIDIGSINVYVRNSFVRTSRPWHENLRPDTVVIDMSTMAYRIVRANLEN
jgi:hypothetical protein